MEKWVQQATGKQVVIVPMVHVQTEKYFADVKSRLDEFKEEGYVVFYEGIDTFSPRQLKIRDSLLQNHNEYETLLLMRDKYPPTADDLAAVDTLQRKYRHLTGSVIGLYTEKSNKAIPSRYKRKKYVDQTLNILGLTGLQDINVDIPLASLIGMWENDIYRIELTDCDLYTPLGAKFDCYKIMPQKAYDVTQTLRNRHIMNTVTESAYDKIVLVYGLAHAEPLRGKLTEMGYRQTHL